MPLDGVRFKQRHAADSAPGFALRSRFTPGQARRGTAHPAVSMLRFGLQEIK
jgi:hypothetical protein